MVISTIKSSDSVVILSMKSNVVSMTVVLSDSVHDSSESVRHASPRFLMDLMYFWDWDCRLNTARGLRSLDVMVSLIGASAGQAWRFWILRGVVSTGGMSLTISISYRGLCSYESNVGVYNISI